MNLCWPNSFALLPDFLFLSDFPFTYENYVKSVRIGHSSSNCIADQDFQRPRLWNDFPYKVLVPNKLKLTTLVWRFKWLFWFTIDFFWKSLISNNVCVNYFSQASNSRWEKQRYGIVKWVLITKKSVTFSRKQWNCHRHIWVN